MNAETLTLAQKTFDPFVLGSGTEHMAWLLYSIVRMMKPRNVLEYGSGYTTFFILDALAENISDFAEQADALRKKTVAAMSARSPTDAWAKAGGKACGVDPGFYVKGYTPQLYCFDAGEQAYTNKVSEAVRQLKLVDLLTFIPGRKFSLDALPQEAFPIDMAWNDDCDYEEFYKLLWPKLNPKGGMMIFHNTSAVESSWRAINYFKEAGSLSGDMELLTLPEPHKLWQNSCTILRRTTEYEPTFKTATRDRITTDLMEFMEQESVAVKE